MPSVKIAIDIRRMTGVRRRHLYPQCGPNSGTAGPRDHLSAHRLSRQSQGNRPAPVQLSYRPLAEPERSLKSYREFRTVVKRLDCDLVHIPNLFSVPRGLSCPYVMTVHDILDHLSRARRADRILGELFTSS